GRASSAKAKPAAPIPSTSVRPASLVKRNRRAKRSPAGVDPRHPSVRRGRLDSKPVRVSTRSSFGGALFPLHAGTCRLPRCQSPACASVKYRSHGCEAGARGRSSALLGIYHPGRFSETGAEREHPLEQPAIVVVPSIVGIV